MDITLRAPAKAKAKAKDTSVLSSLAVLPLLLVQLAWYRLTKPSRHREWPDTVPEERPASKPARPPKPAQRPVDALTRAFNKLPDGRKGARHLHIVEQTLQMTGGSLDDVPLYVLQKAVLQLRVLQSGARSLSLQQLEQDLKNQIFRTDMRNYIDSTRGSIEWSGLGGSPDSELSEIYRGEFVDTSRMPIDVPLVFAPTQPMNLVRASSREEHHA